MHAHGRGDAGEASRTDPSRPGGRDGAGDAGEGADPPGGTEDLEMKLETAFLILETC